MRDFPRGHLWWRFVYAAEDAQGRFPMTIWGPLTGAVAGAWYQFHEHPEIIEHGLVKSVPTSGEVLLGAVVGVAVGTIGAFLLAFAWQYVRYLKWGDPVWESVYSGSVEGTIFCQLSCKRATGGHPTELGRIVCLLKKPSGEIVEYKGALERRHNPYGAVARFQMQPEPGVYQVRWSAAREGQQLHEIAREKFLIPSAIVGDDDLKTDSENTAQRRR
jgi:hypothetical protein